MARKRFSDYSTFLLSAVGFFQRLAPTLSFGTWDLASVEAKKAEFDALNRQILDMEIDLDSARSRRDLLCKEVETFGVHLRGAVLSTFGADTLQFEQLPKLLKHGVGRPNKSAATLKANNLKRKAAAEEARKLAIVEEVLGEGLRFSPP